MSEALQNCLRLWKREFWFVKKLILIFPGHESLWLHRRFLLLHWLAVLGPQMPKEIWIQEQEKEMKEEEYDEDEEEERGFTDSNERAAENGWQGIIAEVRLGLRCISDNTVERYEVSDIFILPPSLSRFYLFNLETN